MVPRRQANVLPAVEGHRIRVVFPCREVSIPELLTPSDSPRGVTLPSPAWESSSGALRYDAYLDTVSPPRPLVAANITNVSFVPANLQPLTTYYWKIVAKGDPFCDSFSERQSEIRSFTTASEGEAPGEFDGEPDGTSELY